MSSLVYLTAVSDGTDLKLPVRKSFSGTGIYVVSYKNSTMKNNVQFTPVIFGKW